MTNACASLPSIRRPRTERGRRAPRRIAATREGRTAESALTAFGANGAAAGAEAVNAQVYFTGKPEIPGLGRAFLMRNYRADLGKWLTADPIGYPDGWNQMAYCGNAVVFHFDLAGAVDINLFNRYIDPVIWEDANHFDNSDVVTVGGHGWAGGMEAIDEVGLAAMIFGTQKWKSGIRTVELVSCCVGRGNYAQRLADLLGPGVVVYAPDQLVWLDRYYDETGGYYVLPSIYDYISNSNGTIQPDLSRHGRWLRFVGRE